MTEKGVQIVFCDIAINEDETHFSVYKAIKQALIERGIPEKEICFAGDAKTDRARDEMFKSLRKGENVLSSQVLQSLERALTFKIGSVQSITLTYRGNHLTSLSRMDVA